MVRQAPRTAAVVPAAGRGLRMGGSTPKQFLTLGGLPILVHALRVLEESPAVTEIILTVPAADREYCLNEIVARYKFHKITKVVPGGEQRQDSVRHGLAELDQDVDVVIVHDAVRPFLTAEMVARAIDAAAEHGAAIVAIPMRDTIKRVGSDGLIESTIDRNHLWLAQTPQAFQRTLLQAAHRKARIENYHATDDAQLMEWLGHRVVIVEGSGENIKITRPEDLGIGEAILAARERR
ncbi:MAG TPA: 2-C-methyl-D-erythritol 4-phosphate cytidylyltransferase [Nitrospiraceae bacterium]|nr:2-C-methyl-D-erythritol 4-phosphate cytidylyltransferase [Nitrospiraceae bacterium]